MERLSLVKRALIANSIFFKTLSESIYTSNMIKGGGQGGLKRKNYGPQASVFLQCRAYSRDLLSVPTIRQFPAGGVGEWLHISGVIIKIRLHLFCA